MARQTTEWVDVPDQEWSITPATASFRGHYYHRRAQGGTSWADLLDGEAVEVYGQRSPGILQYWPIPSDGNLFTFSYLGSWNRAPYAAAWQAYRNELGVVRLGVQERPESRPHIEIPPGWQIEWDTQYSGTITLNWRVQPGDHGFALWLAGDRGIPGVSGELAPGEPGPVREVWADRATIAGWDLVHSQTGSVYPPGPVAINFPRGYWGRGSETVSWDIGLGSRMLTFPLAPEGAVLSAEAEIQNLVSVSGTAYARYRFWRPVSGQWRNRQRQGAGADGWPIRQRQNYGATGSWAVRQRQVRR